MCARRVVQELRSKATAHENEVNFPFISPLSNVFTREQLYPICRTNDLHSVRYLEVTLDLNRTPVHQLLEHLPSLRQLVLTTHGPLASIRELGINAKNLTMIHISNSEIQHLDGISSLSSVIELRLSNNKISDLSPLALHETLEILDLSRNLVDEIVSCETLGTCRRLFSLDLTDNPVSRKTERFRSIICHWIPQLEILDGEDVRPANQKNSLLGVEDASRILPVEDGSCSSQSSTRKVMNDENKLSSRQDALPHGSMAGNVARSILRMKSRDEVRMRNGQI